MSPPPFRFALPPSTSADERELSIAALRAFLERVVGRATDVTLSKSYEVLARNLLSGAVDAGWAPPLVCAQAEPRGARVIVRALRRGRSAYRSALVVRKGEGGALGALVGRRAAWVDPHSVAGYLLPAALLRKHALDPARTFKHQFFAGSYPAALGAVLSEHADVAPIHALDDGGPLFRESLKLAAPGFEDAFELLAVTDETPSDGVVVGPSAGALADQLSRAFLALAGAPEGKKLLTDVFHADDFEPAPAMGYRALYAVAPADL